MAYFDNAATTYPKPECVYQYMDEFYRQSGGNAGRGKHTMALSAASLIADTRKLLQDLLHCPAKQVVFEPSATIALNIIIQGVILNGAKNIYISPFEHNAVTRTLHHYEEKHIINVTQLAVTKELKYDYERIRYQFDAVKPDFVIMSHASNTIGLISPVEEIFSIAKKYNAITLIDMAQTAGLIECNVGSELVDFAAFAGHKTLYGPTGIAGFVMKTSLNLPVVLFGGTGYESANQDMPESIPERYEMGTLNIAGIAGLNAALKWIKATTVDTIHKRELQNRDKLLKALSNYDWIKIVGNNAECSYVGIVSCIIEGISSDSAGIIFNEQRIAVRTGLHCAPLAHQFINTYPAGTIRFSVNYFTEEQDYEELISALEYIEDNI